MTQAAYEQIEQKIRWTIEQLEELNKKQYHADNETAIGHLTAALASLKSLLGHEQLR